jgi:hypothetical protein
VEVEERLLMYKVETYFCIVFDHVPVWLLSLDSLFAASVVIWGVQSARELGHRLMGSTFPPSLLLCKFRFLTIVATMRTADLCDLAWAKYQATGKKLSAVTHSRLSTMSLR